MSDAQANPQAPEAPKLSLLQQFIQQRDAFIQEGNRLSTQFQQVQGAIFACNHLIAKIEAMEALAKKVQGDAANKDNHGENVNGEAHSAETEQTA